MRVLLAGGGSGGSAAPVIAVAQALASRRPDAEFMYIGTRGGPEGVLVRAAGLPYAAVHAGRWRRFATWRNLVEPPLTLLGVAEAVRAVGAFRPHAAFGAGGFGTVPPSLAARLLRVPIVVHQQDVAFGVANRILAPFAARLTVALPETLASLRSRGGRVVGNPVRSEICTGDPARARAAFDLKEALPVVLVTGGGTGALRLNQVALAAAYELANDCQVVHLTGVGRSPGAWSHPNYRQREFVTGEMGDLLAAADVVVTRAGMSALAEVAALRKAAIIVPMPDSHQEANAAVFARHGAGVVLDQRALDGQQLAKEVASLVADADRRATLGAAAANLLPTGAADSICEEIEAVALAGTPFVAPWAR